MYQRGREGVNLGGKVCYKTVFKVFLGKIKIFFPTIDTLLKGQYHWANGNKFVGEFRAGLPGGEGVFETKSGDIFVGSFSNGLPNGQGTTLSSLLVQPSQGIIVSRRVCVWRGEEEI